MEPVVITRFPAVGLGTGRQVGDGGKFRLRSARRWPSRTLTSFVVDEELAEVEFAACDGGDVRHPHGLALQCLFAETADLHATAEHWQLVLVRRDDQRLVGADATVAPDLCRFHTTVAMVQLQGFVEEVGAIPQPDSHWPVRADPAQGTRRPQRLGDGRERAIGARLRHRGTLPRPAVISGRCNEQFVVIRHGPWPHRPPGEPVPPSAAGARDVRTRCARPS